MSEFTKGEWKSKIPLDMEGMHHIFIHSSAGKKLGRIDGHLGGVCCGEGGYPDRAETIANAHLIAAAPDMYEALESLSELFPEDSWEELDASDFKDRSDRIMDIVWNARPILAEAKGESE